MKFQKIHLFIILLLSLIFCGCLGTFMREGMVSQSSYTGSGGNTVTKTTGPGGSSAYSGSGGNTVATGPAGQTVVGTSDNTVNGISYSDIPPGQSDLYILKSEVVPPVCPACPPASACPRQEPCQPCPPCARCPEPAFECKKVPNYSSSNDNFLPRPVLADFSQFGM
jgi:hypothetical protein